MSNVGKRVIWVGPADGENSKPLNVEGIALGASILPGTVVEQNATGLDTNTDAATVFGNNPFLVADKDQMKTRSVDDAWPQNESMVAIQPRSGEFMNVLVATGQAITRRGVGLSRNGAGLLKIALTNGTEEIVAFADEIITTTDTTLVRVRVA